MDKKKVFKVLFKGVILPGFNKEQVIENVYHITRIPKETITRKFFSGKTVVIRHADSQDYASSLQNKFSQAGIETYIEEITDVTAKDTSNDNSEQNDSKQDYVAKPDTHDKKSYVAIGSFIIAVLVLLVTAYFLFDFSIDTSIAPTETLSETISEKIVIEKTSPAAKTAKNNILSESFLSAEQIIVLIKITDTNEFNRLSRFLPLLDIDPAYFDILKQEIAGSESMFPVSAEQPLYLYQSKHHNGIIISTKNKPSLSADKQLQEQFNSVQSSGPASQACTSNNSLSLYMTHNTLILTSLKNKQKLAFLENRELENSKLEKNEWNHSFLKLDHLFYQNKAQPHERTVYPFNFYYRPSNSNLNSLNSSTNTSNYLALSAQGNTFWLAPGKQFYKSSQNLFELFGIKENEKITLSSIKPDFHNLYKLTLLLISQNHIWNSSQLPSSANALAEVITPVKINLSAKEIKPYRNDLDIEFHPQWQSGPFAISTNNYQFDDQLVIELLAKGQNIANLMEYSRAAKIVTKAVYNDNNENILDQKPSAGGQFSAGSMATGTNEKCTDNERLGSYFKDLNGEQEAYTNDDFITYREITAKEKISIKTTHNLQDIVRIQGEIILKLPEKISRQTLDKPFQNHFSKIKDFLLIVNQQADKKRLNYQLVDQKNQFLTLRAYNKSGHVLKTTSFKRQDIIKNNISHYQQSFSEPISEIKVFYTNTIKTLSYQFSLKPEIFVVSTPLSTIDAPPIAFDRTTALDLKALTEQTRSDKPQWMGKQVAEHAVSPFHISLFMHDSIIEESNNKKSNDLDAVFNIKSSVTPLISQNMSAVKISLSENNKSILDNFVVFTEKELFKDEPTESNTLSSNLSPGNSYLNANTTFQFNSKNQQDMNGIITLNLPGSFKTQSVKYHSPGQIIKLNDILVKAIKLSRQEVQFELNGKIENLVQLKLYNAQNKLISEVLEFKQIQRNKALLTLLYNDRIDTIKLVLAQVTTKKEYPFSFAEKTQNQ